MIAPAAGMPASPEAKSLARPAGADKNRAPENWEPRNHKNSSDEWWQRLTVAAVQRGDAGSTRWQLCTSLVQWVESDVLAVAFGARKA